jgi:hypothetical protein
MPLWVIFRSTTAPAVVRRAGRLAIRVTETLARRSIKTPAVAALSSLSRTIEREYFCYQRRDKPADRILYARFLNRRAEIRNPLLWLHD